MSKSKGRRTALGVVLCLGLAIGCNEAEVKTYPVTGTIKFTDGTPLTTGWIRTRPAPRGEDNLVYSARSAIGPDGSFTLETFEKGDGAVAGKHAVLLEVLTAREIGDSSFVDQDAVQNQPTITQRYRTYSASGLEIDVQAEDGPQQFDLEITH